MPNTASQHVAAAEEHLGRGDLNGAYRHARTALSLDRNNGRAHYVTSLIATEKGAHQDALKLCQIAISLDGESGDYLAQLALCHLHLRHRIVARRYASAAKRQSPSSSSALDALGRVFHALGLFADALDCLKALAAQEKSNTVAHSNLGSALVLCGQIGAGVSSFRTALALDSDNADAYYNLSLARQASPADNLIEALERRLPAARDAPRRAKMLMALAIEWENLGDIDASMRYLAQAKAAVAQTMTYVADEDRELFEAIDAYLSAAGTQTDSSSVFAPIFITGMPRSGTTLLERILTNCEDVVSIGESSAFADLVSTSSGIQSDRLVHPRAPGAWPQGRSLLDIAESYEAYVADLVGSSRRGLNKLPLNFLLSPIIVKALPKAKIVHVVRHPLDTIIGNYRMLFGLGDVTYGYANRLEDTAEYVAASRRLADRMAARYPDQFHLLDFEALIRNPAAEAFKVIEFLGLDWRDDLIEIESNKTPAGSASAVQIRTKINDAHSGRWRRYEAYLDPAKRVLDAHNIRWAPEG